MAQNNYAYTSNLQPLTTLLEDQALPSKTVFAVIKIVRLRLLGGFTDIEGVARHLCLSTRSLQRRLTDAGVNYRTILATERYRRALTLLQETEHSITDIAMMLGYSYAEDFTRAFNKLHGCSPSIARRYNRVLL